MARLDRLLANLGYGSRRDVQALVSTGKVTLDGVAVKDAGQKIAVTADLPSRMRIRGVPVDPPAPSGADHAQAAGRGLLTSRGRRADL
jgi:16S rRNA pseudouridine516 synthase